MTKEQARNKLGKLSYGTFAKKYFFRGILLLILWYICGILIIESRARESAGESPAAASASSAQPAS